MKKFSFNLLSALFIVSGITLSCATMGSGKDDGAEVMITRIDSLKGAADVYLNGKKYSIRAGASRLLKIPNGSNNLDVSYQKFSGERVQFVSDSDRNNIKIEVSRENQKPPRYSIAVFVEETTAATIEGNNLEAAVRRAYTRIVKDMPGQSRLALINISSSEAKDGEFVLDELTNLLVNSKRYSIVDRKSLDSIRAERNFQMTGEVDDNSAVDIGKMLGAEIVITGSITGTTDKRLRIKALGVETAQIMTMDTQKFSGGMSGFFALFKKNNE
ncbi:MAG: CsgG/HfaB family protein [Treponema sp.]|jgi:hypothetical protein|nr:CsgG/HfaB family protein [Treponema sp.]